MRRALGLALAITLGLAACTRGGDPAPHLKLDGSPRIANDQGVLTDVDAAHLVLDGRRSYRLSSKLKAFASSTMQAVPLAPRRGQYVQVGTSGKFAVWVATFSVIVALPGKPPTSFYIGTLKRVAEGRAMFREGTVLDVADGVTAPTPLPQQVRADIDVATHRVIALLVLSE